MKDATGELSMTAIAVVAIGAIAVLFSTVVWPRIQGTINRSTNCAQAFKCEPNGDNTKTCTYCANADCSETDTVTCPMDEGTSGTGTTTE